jgi:SAM-dependent methyltransferase
MSHARVTPDARNRFEEFVAWTIREELPARDTFLPKEHSQSFADYYDSLPAAGDRAAIARYTRALWRSEAGWLAGWIAERAGARRNGSPPRVLDAGSGFGTYSFLYGVMGAEVVGCDLRPDRLEVAGLRLRHYSECTGRSLPVSFERADLTRPWNREVDAVWVYNALSHIDPLERFLAEARRHLRPGGVFVVGDINGGLAAHLERLESLRHEIHQEYVAPDGERHAYAVERPFSPRELREIFTQHGFRVVRHELFWGGLSALPDPAYYGALAPLQRQWRLGAGFARRQLFVASPR